MQFGATLKLVPTVVRDILAAPALRTAALLILPYAGVLIGLDIAARYAALDGFELPFQFFLSQDLGFGEYLEYALMSAMAVMLFLLWRDERSPIYLVNALLFSALTADNAFEAHEKFGFWIAPLMPQDLPIEPHHLGEPLLFLAIGLAWLVGLAYSLRLSVLRPVINSLIISGCVGMTAFFGIVVDAAVVYGPHTVQLLEIETFIEDGGEFVMIVVTFLLTVAMFDVERRAKAASAGGTEGPTQAPLAA